MCGINGIIYNAQLNDSVEDQLKGRIKRMNDLIIHRGPDDDGVHQSGNVVMGVRRLSITDLSTGHQPIYNADQSICIVFNGEIYNYKELRKALEDEGAVFFTQTDTEVILKLYEKYGEACVSYLNGMFAFAIHNKSRDEVFISRDRFGEKPLYYSFFDHQFIWASELKSIIAINPSLKQISRQGLSCYFSLSYIPAPLTIYENVFKLKPGHSIVIDTATLKYDIHKYWDIELKRDCDIDPISYPKAKDKIKELLIDSVEKKMIADVPVGVFLSGGVDSTIISAIMAKCSDQKIKTFSVGYHDKRYDESDRAKLVANHIGSKHYQYTFDYKEMQEVVDKVILNYDEPFADSSSLPTYFISHKTRNEVKVALTGDGGDEVFAGYNKYLIHTYGKMYKNIVPGMVRNNVIKPLVNSDFFKAGDSKSMVSKMRKFVLSVNDGVVDNHLNIIALGFKSFEVAQLLNPDYLLDYKTVLASQITIPVHSGASALKVARYIDKQTSLEGDMLTKVDRASMLCSLECRSPFLDHRLMEFAYGLPDHYLISGNNKKKILKDTFKSWLPDDFFNSAKHGFEVPISHWLRDEFKQDLLDTLSPQNLKLHDLFNIKYISQLLDQHLNQEMNHTNKIWSLYCFQKWYNNQL